MLSQLGAELKASSGENQTDESPPIRGIPRLSGSFAGFHLSDSFH